MGTNKNGALLSAADLLAGKVIRTLDVKIEGFGALRLRHLTAEEMLAFARDELDENGKPLDLTTLEGKGDFLAKLAAMVARLMVDDKNEPSFGDPEKLEEGVQALLNKVPASVLFEAKRKITAATNGEAAAAGER